MPALGLLGVLDMRELVGVEMCSKTVGRRKPVALSIRGSCSVAGQRIRGDRFERTGGAECLVCVHIGSSSAVDGAEKGVEFVVAILGVDAADGSKPLVVVGISAS